jgi:hypothetical protein
LSSTISIFIGEIPYFVAAERQQFHRSSHSGFFTLNEPTCKI